MTEDETQPVTEEPESDEEESDPEPSFICGLTIIMLPDGQGCRLNPIKDNPDFERSPTMNDMKAMGQELADWVKTENTVMCFMKALGEAGVKMRLRKGPGGIIGG